MRRQVCKFTGLQLFTKTAWENTNSKPSWKRLSNRNTGDFYIICKQSHVFSDRLTKAMRLIKFALGVADYTFSLFVVTPLVVGHWRGAWYLMDLYLFPSSPLHTAWVAAAAGAVGCLVFYLLQEVFKTVFKTPSRFHRVVTISVYSLTFAVFSISQFRGVWLLWQHYLGQTPTCSIVSTLYGVLGASMFRVGRNISIQPFLMAVDDTVNFFDCPTRFGVKVYQFFE